MAGSRIADARPGTGRAVLGIAAAMAVITAAGVFHVWNAQRNLALRRAIWVEVDRFRTLENERIELRHDQARLTAVPRATVKAAVMGLRPPRADQIIMADEVEEVVP